MGTSTAVSQGRVRLGLAVFALACAFLGAAADAQARGGHYAIDGGNARHRAAVRAALDASSFDWSIVPAQVAIHLVPGAAPAATPGEIWLDPTLLDAGVFSWALVQDEYAHQVDYFLFDAQDRRILNTLLRGTVWCYGDRSGLPHAAYGCERFSSTLVWAYWPVKGNAYRPESRSAESAAMDPVRFRSLVGSLLGTSEPQLMYRVAFDA